MPDDSGGTHICLVRSMQPVNHKTKVFCAWQTTSACSTVHNGASNVVTYSMTSIQVLRDTVSIYHKGMLPENCCTDGFVHCKGSAGKPRKPISRDQQEQFTHWRQQTLTTRPYWEWRLQCCGLLSAVFCAAFSTCADALSSLFGFMTAARRAVLMLGFVVVGAANTSECVACMHGCVSVAGHTHWY